MHSYSNTLQSILKKIILYGVPILYFLIAVSFYLKTYDSAQIKITILHLGGFFLAGTWLLLKIEEGNLDIFKKNFIFLIPILAFLLSGLLSFMHSSFPYTSLNEFTKRFIYCFIALILIFEFTDEKKISRLFNWLIAAAYIVCIYGIIQLLDYYLFPPPPDQGLDPFAWRQAFVNRIFSTFGNPNFFGDFLIVMNPIVLGLYLYKRKFYLMFLWILIFLCTVFTLSKGTWLGFAAGTFVFIVVYLLTFFKDRLDRKTVMTGLITVIVLICVAFFGILTMTKKRTDSASFRIFTWLSAWEMINTNPVFGTGIGSFYVTYPSWRRPQIFFIEAKHNTESDHPENEYLEVWFDEGIIGITVFLLLICFVFTAGYKNITYFHSGKGSRDSPMPYIQLGVLAAFSAQLTHDMVCVSLRFVSSGVMLWLLIGLTVSICVNSHSQNAKEEPAAKSVLPVPVKLIAQIAVIVCTVYAMKYFAGYFKADYLHSIAIQYSKQGDWDMALQTYDRVNKANPSFPMSRYFKANVHLDRWKSGDAAMTEKTFDELWKIAPNYVQSKFLAGLMYGKMFTDTLLLREEYLKKGETEKVKEAEKKAIENFNLALKYYNEYIMIDPIYPLTYYRVAELYSQVGNPALAEQTLRKHLAYPSVLDKHPHDFWVEDWTSRRMFDYSETHGQIANLYITHGKFKEAVAEYEESIRIFPRNISSWKNLAVAYARVGEEAKMKEAWIEIHRMFPDDNDARQYLQALGVIPGGTEKK